MRAVRPSFVAVLATTFSAVGAAVPAHVAAQSLLYRPPNLGGTWVPAGGVLQFNFLHRFSISESPNYVVTNYPTFTFALGLGRRIALGTRFSTRSPVGTGSSSNEFEFYGRMAFGAEEGKNGLAIAVTPAYNSAAESIDGELGVDLTRGPITLSAAGRVMSQALPGPEARFGAAGGLSLRLNDYIALDGDVATLFDAGLDAAWSAGLSFLIPGSPHTFSLHAGNAASTTIQGASFGVGAITYGFEFTIPIHFSRFAPWFGKKAVTAPSMNAAAQVEMREYRFGTDSVVISAGQSVGWINNDEVVHTVTFDAAGAQSSGDIAKSGTYVATFAKPGVYRYHCAPHPAMKGVVVVK